MNKIEEFYKEAGGIEYDKFDKKADKFTYYDMIGFADAYHSKQLIIADVSQQREPLLAYHKHLDSFNDPTIYNASESMIDNYLKSNNCG